MRHACSSDVAVINTGAHSAGLAGFEEDLSLAFGELLRRCGAGVRAGLPLVFFRTTPEGNPFCNSPEHRDPGSSMDRWAATTWYVAT